MRSMGRPFAAQVTLKLFQDAQKWLGSLEMPQGRWPCGPQARMLPLLAAVATLHRSVVRGQTRMRHAARPWLLQIAIGFLTLAFVFSALPPCPCAVHSGDGADDHGCCPSPSDSTAQLMAATGADCCVRAADAGDVRVSDSAPLVVAASALELPTDWSTSLQSPTQTASTGTAPTHTTALILRV